MRVTKRRLALFIAIGVVIVATALAFRPRPIAVSAARAARGALMATIDEQGITRVRERYVVASPIAGRHARIDLHAGDKIEPGTILVRIDPAPLDARTVAELTSRAASAERIAAEAAAASRRAQAIADQARRDHDRLGRLSAEGIAASETLEQARTSVLQSARDADAARFRAEAAVFDVKTARAALLAAGSESTGGTEFVVRSPIHGRVLRVAHESEGVVIAGAPLLEIGDTATMEAVIDVLSADAVRVRPGDEVLFEQWGGETPLSGTVRLVEPSAFTKLSALGVDEQRVNVIADFANRPQELGDAYRIHARIVTWRGDALKVPSTALFRDAGRWSLFVIDRGRVKVRPVSIGHHSATETEIAGGLRPGELVVTHPSEQLSDGTRVSLR